MVEIGAGLKACQCRAGAAVVRRRKPNCALDGLAIGFLIQPPTPTASLIPAWGASPGKPRHSVIPQALKARVNSHFQEKF